MGGALSLSFRRTAPPKGPKEEEGVIRSLVSLAPFFSRRRWLLGVLGTGEGGEKGLRACDKSIGKRRSVRRPPSPPPPPPPGSPTPPRRRRRRGPHPGPSISGLWRPRPRTGDRSRRPHIGSEVEGEGGECPAVGRSGERRRAKLMCLLSPETTAQPPRIPSLLPPKDHPSSSHAPTWGSTVDRRRTHLAIRPTLVLDPADHPSSPPPRQ